ncbi:MAG: sulfurtransferase [Nitrospirae bacterium]|nr:sulfurtransferase [Nitrospirota bacterium]
MNSQQTIKGVIIGGVAVILGFLVVYSQTGIPEGSKEQTHQAAAAGYGGAGSPRTPLLEYVGSPATPEEEKTLKKMNLYLLTQPEELEKSLGMWIVVDCRPKDLYDEGHIPTAIHLGETCNDFFRDDLEIKGITDRSQEPGERKQEAAAPGYGSAPGYAPAAGYGGTVSPKTTVMNSGTRSGLLKDLALGQVENLEKKLGRIGITRDKTLVFYDQRENSDEAGRGRYYGIFSGYVFVPFWYMEYLGHKDVRVLDGGIGIWTAGGKPLEQKTNKLTPVQFKADVVKSRLATTEEVLKIAKKEEDAQLIDSRTIAEYLGESPTPPGHFLADKIKRAGRIPNTIRNVPHFYQFIDPQTAKLRPIYQLQRLYGGLDKDKRTVLYCYIANRISFSYFVLRLLGFKDPAIYHDSWIVWGNDETLPVETGKKVAD